MSEPELTVADLPLPGGDFQLFVARLSLQGLLSLGLMDNPLTGSRNVNLPGARTMIQDLLLLREKTHGNLEPEEAEHLDKVIELLEHHYERHT